MFVDKVSVTIAAGKGGDGIVSFRHEKFIDKGGPDGGDGGDGGNVVFRASNSENTLSRFRHQKRLNAQDGQNGMKARKHGKSGDDLVVDVPVGTVVYAETGEVLADLVASGQTEVVAHGGKGGFGNAHFTSSTRQAPRLSEKGEPGELFKAALELKMIADVGLVGLPNAGKSTLLSVISNAQPEIADYPFTTIRPNLGVVDVDQDTTLLFADIPGLIEGASQGKGLGDDFLRHVERSGVLVHLIDIYNDDVTAAYRTIQKELKEYQTDLSRRPQIVAITKTEGLDREMIDDKISELKRVVMPRATPVMAISAQSGHGVKDLLYKVKAAIRKARTAEPATADDVPVYRLTPDMHGWQVAKDGDTFIVTGHQIERFARRTHFDEYHGVQRLRDIMAKQGIMKELLRLGIQDGQTVEIGSPAIGSIEY